MKLQPIVYTTSMDSAVEWYAAVLGAGPDYRSDMWTSFSVGGGTLALHWVDDLPEDSRVALSLVADESLENVIERVSRASIPVVRGIQDEAFGRSMLLRDPEGLTIQVNEHHQA